MRSSVRFSRRLLVAIDARGYGSRTDRGQAILQEGLPSVLAAAAQRAELDREDWDRQVTGDGEVCIMPASFELEPVIVDDFVDALAIELDRYNAMLKKEYHLRLRVAIHFGTAMPAEMGYTGQGMVQVNRLVECAQVRSLLKHEGVNLAVILSDNVFQDVVVQEHTSLSAGDFKEVMVINKEYSRSAWVRAPGWDVRAMRVDGEAPGPPVAASGMLEAGLGAGLTPAQIHAVQKEFHRDSAARQINIGGGGA